MTPGASTASAPRPRETRTIEAPDGTRLRVLRFASRGPARGRILFVPGFLSFVESWELVLAELVQCFAVDYFESREKRSAAVPEGARFRLAEFVADLGAATVQLGLEPGGFDAVASSSGAGTLLAAHARLDVRPRRMVWISPVLRPVLPWIVGPLSRVLRGPLYPVLQRAAIWWYERVLNPPGKDPFQHSRFLDVVRRADPRKIARAARDIQRLDLDPQLARDVDAPVLVLAASHDLSHRFEDCVRLGQLLPGGAIEDLGAFWRTHAPAAGRTIVRFLAADDRAPAGDAR